MLLLTNFEFFFCPALYIHKSNIPHIDILSRLNNWRKKPQVNQLIFKNNNLSYYYSKINSLQKIVLLSEESFNQFFFYISFFLHLKSIKKMIKTENHTYIFKQLSNDSLQEIINLDNFIVGPLPKNWHCLLENITNIDSFIYVGYQFWLAVINIQDYEYIKRANLRLLRSELDTNFIITQDNHQQAEALCLKVLKLLNISLSIN